MGNNMINNIKIYKYSRVILLTFILGVLSLSPLTLANTGNTPGEITSRYTFHPPQLTTVRILDEQYDQIVLSGAPCSGNPGEPSLPTAGAYLLLPYHTRVIDIVVTGEPEFFGSGYTILPQSVPVPISKKDLESIPTPDETIYSSQQMFPGRLFTNTGIYSFRGYQILVLMLHPIQYIPTTGEIYYYTHLEVTVTLTPDDTESLLYRGEAKDKIQIMQKVDNPGIVETYPEHSSGSEPMEEYDLLIITTEELKDEFEPLKNVHDADGLPTVIKTLTDIGSTDQEDIRSYIRDAYTNWGIEYVLLGGDDNVVPARILWVFGLDEGQTPYETYMPSDLYYACLDGTYNYDGDDKWGEPTDGDGGADVDLIADVYVGRACVGSSAEVTYFVDKTISYLTISEDPYLSEAVFVGEYLGNYGIASWGGNYCDQLINGSSDDGYTTTGIPADVYNVTKVYDRDWPGHNWPKSVIMNLIDQGVYFINHLGHSSYNYNLKMGNDDVSSLTNEKYCFIYSQGCMAGGFDNDDCIAEYFTIKDTNGAFAGIWNARYGWFWSYSTDGDSQRFHREYWDAVFGEGIPEISRANHDSKEDNLYIINRSCIRWVYYQTNLFGDPTLSFGDTGPRPHITISDIKGGLSKISAILKNEGDADATNIDWSITITGGFFDLINVQTEDHLPLAINETSAIQTDKLLIGIGPLEITVRATYARTWTGTGFILGPFLLSIQ